MFYFKRFPPMTFYDSPYIKHVVVVLLEFLLRRWISFERWLLLHLGSIEKYESE